MTDARERQADALAETLRREASGKLTVFLGAAPGVGKTCAMLNRAQEQQRRGVDVLIGLLETHGRADTAAMAEGVALPGGGTAAAKPPQVPQARLKRACIRPAPKSSRNGPTHHSAGVQPTRRAPSRCPVS